MEKTPSVTSCSAKDNINIDWNYTPKSQLHYMFGTEAYTSEKILNSVGRIALPTNYELITNKKGEKLFRFDKPYRGCISYCIIHPNDISKLNERPLVDEGVTWRDSLYINNHQFRLETEIRAVRHYVLIGGNDMHGDGSNISWGRKEWKIPKNMFLKFEQYRSPACNGEYSDCAGVRAIIG